MYVSLQIYEFSIVFSSSLLPQPPEKFLRSLEKFVGPFSPEIRFFHRKPTIRKFTIFGQASNSGETDFHVFFWLCATPPASCTPTESWVSHPAEPASSTSLALCTDVRRREEGGHCGRFPTVVPVRRLSETAREAHQETEVTVLV